MLLELKGAKPKRVQVDPEPEPEADRVWRARYWGNLSVSDDELERRYGAPTWAVLCYPMHAEWIEDDARLTRLAQDWRLASPTAASGRAGAASRSIRPAKGEIASSGSPGFQNQPQALANGQFPARPA